MGEHSLIPVSTRNSTVTILSQVVAVLPVEDCTDWTTTGCLYLLHATTMALRRTYRMIDVHPVLQGLHGDGPTGYCYCRRASPKQIPAVAVVGDGADIDDEERACNAGSDYQCPLRRSLVMLRTLP
jgi:hypothetical protein